MAQYNLNVAEERANNKAEMESIGDVERGPLNDLNLNRLLDEINDATNEPAIADAPPETPIHHFWMRSVELLPGPRESIPQPGTWIHRRWKCSISLPITEPQQSRTYTSTFFFKELVEQYTFNPFYLLFGRSKCVMARTVIAAVGDIFNPAQLHQEEWTLSRLLQHLGTVII